MKTHLPVCPSYHAIYSLLFLTTLGEGGQASHECGNPTKTWKQMKKTIPLFCTSVFLRWGILRWKGHRRTKWNRWQNPPKKYHRSKEQHAHAFLALKRKRREKKRPKTLDQKLPVGLHNDIYIPLMKNLLFPLSQKAQFPDIQIPQNSLIRPSWLAFCSSHP